MGKKKKGSSNKLAKMSDEERARYLQHRAQVEEEAKRRKEQLIATFLKNKMRREEAFTRLNTAKINEYWHQILRKIAIKNMKSEIQSLSKWINKVVEVRNRLISKLMTEIEGSEEQYQTNFVSHVAFIDQFLAIHHERQEYIRRDFEVKNSIFLMETSNERNELREKNEYELTYLKTIIYAMEFNFETETKEYKNRKTNIIEDYSTSFRAEHEAMVLSYLKTMEELWQKIYHVLNDYLKESSAKRHHYIELKHLDDRNEAEREQNDNKIAHFHELIKNLKEDHEIYIETSILRQKRLQDETIKVKKDFEHSKRKLKSNLDKFEKDLTFMTVCANNSLKELSKIIEKGRTILQLVNSCRKLETEDEKSSSWNAMRRKWYDLHGLSNLLEEGDRDKEKDERVVVSSRKIRKKDLEPESQVSLLEKSKISSPKVSKPKLNVEKVESQNGIQVTQMDSGIGCSNSKKESSTLESKEGIQILAETEDQEPNLCREIVIYEPRDSSTPDTIDSSCFQTDQDVSFLEKSQSQIVEEFRYLENLNSLCWVQNRVEMEIIELKAEKSKLIEENKRLKDIIKGILEDAVLEPKKPKKPSLKVRPNISSAPASISSSKWGRQVPTCVVLSFD